MKPHQPRGEKEIKDLLDSCRRAFDKEANTSFDGDLVAEALQDLEKTKVRAFVNSHLSHLPLSDIIAFRRLFHGTDKKN